MLVVLASRFDTGAAALVERWSGRGARLLTPADLSRPGWRDYSGGSPGARGAGRAQAAPHGGPGSGQAVVSGEVVAVEAITGVLVRLPVVFPEELRHIVPEDREYVAAEMTAFLVWWLTRLSCPVLNRPTPISLCGPGWRAEKWALAAAGLGIPARARSQDAPERVVVLGGRCIGACTPARTTAALRLAGAARVSLLQVEFEGDAFVGASSFPALEEPTVAAALLELLSASGA